jgi:hypothetical protein
MTNLQLVESARPANALSITDNVAVLVLEPFTRELTEAEKADILAAERVRVFVDSRVDANLSRPVSAPIKLTDYPADTMKFCVDNADYVGVGVLDCSKASLPEEIESIMAQFDSRDVDDRRFVIRVLSDSPFDLGDYLSIHRPSVPFGLASPNYAEDTAET